MAEIVYREEPESGITLGPFDTSKYYNIEKSSDVKISRQKTLKSVECVALWKNKLLFIETKKSAPAILDSKLLISRLTSMIKPSDQNNYEQLIHSLKIMPAYISDVCEKFIMSLCLVMSIVEGRVPSDDMPPSMIEAIRDPTITPVFLLIINWSKKDWAKDVMDAFNIALQKFQKTNRAEILVLTAEQAHSKRLVSEYIPMPVQMK